jgi:hypothetical protein
MTIEARLHAPADDAKIVVLGPRGSPRTLASTFDREHRVVRARFALERPGAFAVQVVADLDGGPRPVLEASVYADVAPPATDDAATAVPVPGESPAAADLVALVNALRAAEEAPPLVHDPRLEAIARKHAERMRDDARIAHDLGEGDLRSRFAEAGLDANLVGENVARSTSLVRAHRALYASPSHRLNLLRADYTHVGTAAVTATDGAVYVCEVFAGGLR